MIGRVVLALLLLVTGVARAEVCATTGTPNTYAVWDATHAGASWSLSGGNLTATSTAANGSAFATVGLSAGKHYFEVKLTTAASGGIGVSSSRTTSTYMGTPNSYELSTGGNLIFGASGSGYSPSWGNGDVIGVAVDIDAGKVWFSKNGAWLVSASPVTGANPAYTGATGTLYPGLSQFSTGNGGGGTAVFVANFGATTLEYVPPAGFSAGWYVAGTEVTTCAGTYVCSAATSTACSTWVKLSNDHANVSTFDEVGMTGDAMAGAVGGGVGLVLLFVFIGRGFGAVHRVLSIVLGGHE